MAYETKRKSEDIPESCKMKHDFQLQKELKELFNAQGLDPIIGVERRRGRIKVQCKEGDYLLTASIVRHKHPDFITKAFENGFVEFRNTI
jgi:hypothetical protein